MASFSVYREELRNGSIETWSQKETIAWGLCTSPPTLETFSKKISVSTHSNIEIASLLKKKMKKKMTGNREIVYGQILTWRIGTVLEICGVM